MRRQQGSEEFNEWFKKRPKIIQEAILKRPPDKTYQFITSKKQCYIISYQEPSSPGNAVTLVVQKTGTGGPLAAMGLSAIDQNQVFGVQLDDIEEVPAS